MNEPGPIKCSGNYGCPPLPCGKDAEVFIMYECYSMKYDEGGITGDFEKIVQVLCVCQSCFKTELETIQLFSSKVEIIGGPEEYAVWIVQTT